MTRDQRLIDEVFGPPPAFDGEPGHVDLEMATDFRARTAIATLAGIHRLDVAATCERWGITPGDVWEVRCSRCGTRMPDPANAPCPHIEEADHR